MNNTTIDTANGPIEIDAKLLNGYISESAGHYAAIDAAKNDLKLIVEALAEKSGVKAGLIAKYIKAKYDDRVKDTAELADLFEQLDAATGV